MQRVNSIEVFKTNVCCSHQSEKLLYELSTRFPGTRISFDLDDCDRVLRMEGRDILSCRVVELLSALGFECGALE